MRFVAPCIIIVISIAVLVAVPFIPAPVVAVIPGISLVIAPVHTVADEHSGIGRCVAERGLAIRCQRLVTRRPPVEPDSALSRWWELARRRSPVMAVSLSEGG
jgi:hypothetical protein